MIQAVGASMTNVPGIWTEEQIQGWTQIVSDVKATGAVFVAQREYCLAHCNVQDGRIIG